MKKFKIKSFVLIGLILVLVIGGFILKNNAKLRQVSDKEKITVFYSPTCSCCLNYIAYLKNKGYEVESVIKANLNSIKQSYGVPSYLSSCHTAVIENYVVEGHIPVEVIKKLLAEKHNISGIALAGMPSGSPGMPGPKLGPFQIHAITKDGRDGGIFMEF